MIEILFLKAQRGEPRGLLERGRVLFPFWLDSPRSSGFVESANVEESLPKLFVVPKEVMESGSHQCEEQCQKSSENT